MKRIIPLALYSFSTLAQPNTGYVQVLVKKGDTLSDLLETHFLRPIYGRKGNLLKTIELNPHLAKRPNLLKPGETIILPKANQEANLAMSDQVEKIPDTVEVEDTPVATYEPEEKLFRESRYTIKLGASFLRTDGDESGNSGTIGSTASPNAELMWSPRTGEKVTWDLGGKITSVNVTEDSKKTLTSKSQTLNKIFLGFNYEYSEKLRAEVQAGLNEELFYESSSDHNKVQKVGVPYLQLGGRYHVTGHKNTKTYVRGAYRAHLPFEAEDMKGDLGHGLYSSFLIEETMTKYVLFGEAYFAMDQFNSRPVDFDTRELGLSLGVRF